MRYVLYALLAWFLYNLIFRFIIPVYKTTRQVKKKFREMHEQMQQEQVKQQGFNQQAPAQKSSPSSRNEDYIDFEEIKQNRDLTD
jgi:hypothetical protein